jgi:dUTP pyrophosphatase
MAKFEKVSRFNEVDLPLPVRKTAESAGYDFVVAEDIIIPPYSELVNKMKAYSPVITPTLDVAAAAIKAANAKISLVSTGMKCQLDPGTYLELSVRSSCPLKHWLILGNAVGIIDADYYNNPDNEGEIFFQIINLAPFAIHLKRGDAIGQGIIKEYHKVEGDIAKGVRKGGFGSTDEQVLASAT